jgi:hypothetical protein
MRQTDRSTGSVPTKFDPRPLPGKGVCIGLRDWNVAVITARPKETFFLMFDTISSVDACETAKELSKRLKISAGERKDHVLTPEDAEALAKIIDWIFETATPGNIGM